MNVDLPFAALVLAACYYAFAFANSHSLVYLAFALVSTSLFLGIKSTGTMYAVIILLMLLLSVCTKLKRQQIKLEIGKNRILKMGLCLLILAPGGFWYLYNLIHYANPLVGVEITFLGHRLFSGMYTLAGLSNSSLIHVFDPLRANDLRVLADQIFNKLSYPILLLSLFSLAFILLSMRRIQELLRSGDKIMLLALSALTFIIYVRTPFSGNYNASMNGLTPFVGQAFRLGFPCLGLIAVVGAMGIEKLKLGDRFILILMLCLFILTALDQRKLIFLVVGTTAILLVNPFDFLSRSFRIAQKNKLRLGVSICSLCILLLSLSMPFLERLRSQNRMKRSYGTTATFIDQALSKQERIAFTNCDRSYVFFGTHFSHDVVSIPYQALNFTGWLKALKEKEIQIVAVGPSSSPLETIEIKKMLQDFPEKFQLIFSSAADENATLYRILN